MRQNMEYSGLGFSVLGVFGPQLDHLATKVDSVLECGMNQARRGQRFRGGPDQDRGFPGPGERLLAVAVSISKMQDLFAVSPDTDRSAKFAQLVEILCEKLD